MSGSKDILLSHIPKVFFGRKLVGLVFLMVCTCLLLVYWMIRGQIFGQVINKSHAHQITTSSNALKSVNHTRLDMTREAIEKRLLHAVNKLPFRVMTPSSLLLEDLYFIPSTHIHAYYNESILLQPVRDCGGPGTFLLILVPSHPSDVSMRQAIRETWGSAARGREWPWRGSSYPVKLVFVLGVTPETQSGRDGSPLTQTHQDGMPETHHKADKVLTTSKHPLRLQSTVSPHSNNTTMNDPMYTKSISEQTFMTIQEGEFNMSRQISGYRMIDQPRLSVHSQTESKDDTESGLSRKYHSTEPHSYRFSANLKSKLTYKRRERRDSHVTLNHEKNSFDDILQFSMVDSYKNLTLKLLLALKWTAASCDQVRYILKADQDVFVNVPLLTSFLQHHGERNSMYGHIYANAWVERKGKWAVSKQALPIPRYPIYAAGNAYVLSKDSAAKILELAPHFPYIPVEDAFITGVLASVAKVNRVNVGGFTKWTEPRPSACEFVNDRKYVGNNFTEFYHRMVWRDLIDKGSGLCDPKKQ